MKYLKLVILSVSISIALVFSSNANLCAYQTYVDNGKPTFYFYQKHSTKAFEKYSDLDSLGRCGVAFANICKEMMPTEPRGSIGMIKPAGWQVPQSKYDFVDGKFLYNRCHLIGFNLAGEKDNPKNLITGTRYMNIYGMLPFENKVAKYVKETGNHCLYRVTPVYTGNNLICDGVRIEAYSVEDKGQGINFNVFCYNIQPGVIIDYRTGENWLDEEYFLEKNKYEVRVGTRSIVVID